MPLLVKIVIAIAAGVSAGFISPDWLTRLFMTFNSVFSSFLGFLIPLLIVGFVAPAIASLGTKAGKMLVATALIAYMMTFAVGMSSFFVAEAAFPHLLPDVTVSEPATTGSIAPYFTIDIEPMMSVMTALVLAFLLGLGSARLHSNHLRGWLEDFREVINTSINGVIIPCLPIYIFSIFLNMSVTGTAGPILITFAGIVCVIFALHIAVLILQYTIASAFSGINPLKALRTMLPAYFTALGTQSSAATIPVTLRQTISTGVDPSTAGFVIPLCATIHMSGSTLKIVCCAVALMLVRGLEFDAGLFAGFIAMLGITIIAAPGVPGGAIMASLGLLTSILGFSEADNALMIALYIAMDSFGTACNITGDGAIAQIVAGIFGKKTAATQQAAIKS